MVENTALRKACKIKVIGYKKWHSPRFIGKMKCELTRKRGLSPIITKQEFINANE